MAPNGEIEAALLSWRAAQRRIDEADGNVTPEMEEELRLAKARYQDIAAAHMTEQLDAKPAAERDQAAIETSADPFQEAVAEG